MNNKAKYLYEIVDIAVQCCATEISEDGRMSLTKDEVLGRSRAENVVMTRCIAVMAIINAGYSVTTVAQLFKRSAHAIRDLIKTARAYEETSRAYRIANAEVTLKCRNIEASGL